MPVTPVPSPQPPAPALILIPEPFDLESTLLSGQAFRWRKHDPWFYGVAFNNILQIRQTERELEVLSSPDDPRTLEPLLRDYLGLSHDLEEIYAGISTDVDIAAAIDRYRGLRILSQDPWECLVSFICSSASNIPRIAKNIESICDAYGRPIWLGEYLRNSFPTPWELAEADETALRGLGLGYRAEYIAATTRAVVAGGPDLMTLREAPYEEALEALTALPGVGDKVANCVLLFSLDKPEAFPVDTHIRATLREMYPDSQSAGKSDAKMRLWAQDRFGLHAGYANQYLFHDRRLQDKG